MTKTYALCKLLEHGPMTRREIVECTQWKSREVGHVLACALLRRQVRRADAVRVGNLKTATLYRLVGC